MILRGDGKSNLHCDDFLMKNPKQLQPEFRATVGMLNPPYSQGTKNDPDLYEISFTEHLLDSLLPNSKCAVIVPQSSMTGKTNEEKSIKENILKHHTLEGVIMLQKDTFYGIGVIPCIAVFTSGQPHPKDKICKFINFEDDGYKVAPHIGLLETEAAKDRKQHLLDVWFDRIEAENRFCVKTTVTAEDEWLHSFYYFNDEIPTQEDFEKTVGDYLTFEFSMIMQGRKYLFEEDSETVKKNFKEELESREWREFFISGNEGVFKIESTSSGIDKNKINLQSGNIPYITRSDVANGINLFLTEEQQSKYSIDSGNCITIGLDTQTVFYQPHSFFTGQNIQVLSYEHCTKENALFISKLIQLQMVKFNWGGNGATLGRLVRTKILLPVTSSGEIDYEFMESFIQKLENAKLDEYKKYAKKRVNEILFSKKIESVKLEEKNWKAFQLSDVFNISPGVRLTSANMKSGNRPFVGASDSNNGITNFVSNENKSIDKNVLGVNYNGSVVENFYHPYECIFSDDVKRFHLKNWKDNKFSLLFMKTVILQQKIKFLYAYKFNEKRMQKQNIILPTTPTGEPDYLYMENYIRNIMLKKYSEYLDFKLENISEYPSVLDYGHITAAN